MSAYRDEFVNRRHFGNMSLADIKFLLTLIRANYPDLLIPDLTDGTGTGDGDESRDEPAQIREDQSRVSVE